MAKTCVIVGQGLIGSSIELDDYEIIRVSHRASRDTIAGLAPDLLVNCTFDPATLTDELAVDQLLDVAYARLVPAHGRYVMMSSRKAYAQVDQWDAHEDALAWPDGAYGRNKRKAEAALGTLLGPGRYLALRLPNIYGDHACPGRAGFFATMMTSLQSRGEINFDFGFPTRRDFLYSRDFSLLFSRLMDVAADGIINLGYGQPINCADVAGTLIRGYGSGRLTSSSAEVRDEFYLGTDKLASLIPVSGLVGNEDAVFEIGRALRTI